MARRRFRIFARGLRSGISAGRRRVSVCLSALGMAAVVFCWRIAGVTHAVRPRKSERARSLASFADGLDELPPSDLWKFAALCLPRHSDGHGELYFARHTRHVPHVSATPARI